MGAFVPRRVDSELMLESFSSEHIHGSPMTMAENIERKKQPITKEYFKQLIEQPQKVKLYLVDVKQKSQGYSKP